MMNTLRTLSGEDTRKWAFSIQSLIAGVWIGQI
jgi:hypothetical protein